MATNEVCKTCYDLMISESSRSRHQINDEKSLECLDLRRGGRLRDQFRDSMELGCNYCGLLWQAVAIFWPSEASSTKDKPPLRFYINIEPDKPIFIEELTTRLAVEIYTETGQSSLATLLLSKSQSKIGVMFQPSA